MDTFKQLEMTNVEFGDDANILMSEGYIRLEEHERVMRSVRSEYELAVNAKQAEINGLLQRLESQRITYSATLDAMQTTIDNLRRSKNG